MDPASLASDNIGGGLRAFAIVMTVLSAVSLICRIWSRALHRPTVYEGEHRFWWDDWIALATGVFCFAQMGVIIAMIDFAGLGRHIGTLTLGEIALFSKLLFTTEQLFGFTICLSKVSALLFYKRLFLPATDSKTFRTAFWTVFALNIAWEVGARFGSVFNCTPVAASWDPFMRGKCGSTTTLFFATALTSAFVDLCIMILPLPKIWGLRMTTWRKIGLSIVFFLASW
ncbi:hypothetical protein PFICI_05368 [Pestalotiopsis fici W106-1]|uniref:Rhodopsin domain-containing protein n=1 Tax=Pestalotiopsis fici (strain W106-1 / CGMCC3.15140) TaxID=1229662 RepID=W3XDJ2_PESFW|nr:uncharacterized protein PFICI_05368 [Pestalotiopsis fici W106-1]ETS83492.1 hypothetical protein PFICI_05368 [Pestalotiopsis fici W106-1]